MRTSIIKGLGLVVALAGVAAAQQPADHGAHRPGADSARPRFERRGGGPDGFLLRDITLTDAQKTQLESLRKTERERMKTGREADRKEFEAVKAARQRGDTAAARALMQKQRQEMQQLREQHLASLRTILTAEQRIQLDKNLADMKERGKERAKERGGRLFGAGRGGRGFGS